MISVGGLYRPPKNTVLYLHQQDRFKSVYRIDLYRAFLPYLFYSHEKLTMEPKKNKADQTVRALKPYLCLLYIYAPKVQCM